MARSALRVNAGLCRDPKLYRAPYGAQSDRSTHVLHKMGMRNVHWSLDTLDWVLAESDREGMLAKVATAVASAAALHPHGIIHLQHESVQGGIDALPSFVANARNGGYQLVSMERCVYGPEYKRVSPSCGTAVLTNGYVFHVSFIIFWKVFLECVNLKLPLIMCGVIS